MPAFEGLSLPSGLVGSDTLLSEPNRFYGATRFRYDNV
jgi:hypothetical protein